MHLLKLQLVQQFRRLKDMNSLLRILHKQPRRCYDLKFSSDPRNMKDLRLKLKLIHFFKKKFEKKTINLS